jgi:site-specific DNA-methyltransferase (adenine-specific)
VKITLQLGDCLREMDKLDNQSVDLVLADLPYGTTACNWDTPLPFSPMWDQLNRICKKSAAMVFTAAMPFAAQLIASNIATFRYDWIWEKPQGTNPLNAKKMPLRSHESILVFYREPPTYNPQMTDGTPYSAFFSSSATIGEVYGSGKSIHRGNPTGTRYPKTIIKYKQEKGLHPTQKPVPLFEYLIRTYSNDNDVVLDPTMGSGTTGVACARAGRRFIGIEKDENYFNAAKRRIEDAANSGILIGPASNDNCPDAGLFKRQVSHDT